MCDYRRATILDLGRKECVIRTIMSVKLGGRYLTTGLKINAEREERNRL